MEEQAFVKHDITSYDDFVCCGVVDVDALGGFHVAQVDAGLATGTKNTLLLLRECPGYRAVLGLGWCRQGSRGRHVVVQGL